MGSFKKKETSILIILAVIFIASALVVNGYRHKSSSGESNDDKAIPYSVVNSTKSIFRPLANRSIKRIADSTLDNTGYTIWKGYDRELEVLIKETDFVAKGGSGMLAAISLPPDEGIVAYYKREGKYLTYMGKVPGLLPVKDISLLNNAYSEKQLIAIDQEQNEMLGAFFKAQYRDVFLWKDGYFDRVLGLLIHYDAYWNKAWDGVKEDTYWLWLNQSSDIRHSRDGEIISVNYVQTLFQSTVADADSIPVTEDFATRYYRMIREEYRWNSQWGLYILGEYIDRQTGENVALLEDYRNNVSGFIRGTEFDMVKVVDRKGRISIISVNRLQPVSPHSTLLDERLM